MSGKLQNTGSQQNQRKEADFSGRLGEVTVLLKYKMLSCFPIASIFTPKTPPEENTEDVKNDEEDDFQTDEDEEMEVDKQDLQKRKKVSKGLK